MNKQYRKENFESRDEALIWSAYNKPIYNSSGDIEHNPRCFAVETVCRLWDKWHKAIEVVLEKRLIEVWVNVYTNRIGAPQTSLKAAQRIRYENSLGTVKLSKEITIIDGKVVEDETNN